MMENQPAYGQEEEIDLVALTFTLLRKYRQILAAALACACERFKSARKEQQCDQGLAFPAFVAKELNVSRKELRHRCDCVQQAGA